MAKLGEVCLINPKSCTLRDDTEVSFIPMTKVGEHGEFDASEIKNYSEVKKGFTNFQNGDILFAKITPCMENGKGAIAHNMKNGIGFGSTEFHVLRPDTDKITSEWLYYLTTWKTFRKEAERNMTGSAGQKRVPKTFLENYVVNLPDIDTQKSENKILRKVDDLIFLRKQQLAKLDELVKARFVEMFENSSWPNTSLNDICSEIVDCPHSTPKYEGNLEHPAIRTTEIKKGYIDWDSMKYVSEEEYQKRIKSLKPVPGDIVYGREGTYGNAAIIPDGYEFCLGQRVMLFRPNKTKCISAYVLYAILSDHVKRQADEKNVGATVPHVNVADAKQFDVVLPPLSIQNQFAAFVERVDQQKQTVQQSLEKLELMKKALMQEYFG